MSGSQQLWFEWYVYLEPKNIINFPFIIPGDQGVLPISTIVYQPWAAQKGLFAKQSTLDKGLFFVDCP